MRLPVLTCDSYPSPVSSSFIMRMQTPCNGSSRVASILALAVFGRPCTASNNVTAGQILNDPFPYYFPQENAPASQLFPMPQCNGVQIEQASIDQLQTYMAHGSLTSVQLVVCYMQRSFQTAEYIKLVLLKCLKPSHPDAELLVPCWK